MKDRVLLLGGNDRSALAVARSLAAANVAVEVARIGASSMCEASKYVARTVDLGDARRHVRKTADRLIEHLARESFDLVLPMGDTAAELAAYAREDISRRTKLAMPDRNAYALCHDKEQTVRLAGRLGIPAPAYHVLRRWEDIDSLDLTNGSLPCYLKPCYSARVVGDSIIPFRVRKARTAEQFLDFCRFNLANAPIMVQEECQGVGAGVYLLADHGRVLSMVQQIRLHEPSDGGGSSYRMTVPLDPILVEYAHAFVEESEWHGVAMVEFKGDPGRGNWFLMEVNGRFWGSLALTVRAGLDFPKWLYQLETGPTSSTSFAVVNPKLHIRHRHLKKDVGWVADQLRRSPHRARLLRNWIGTFRHLLNGTEGLDSESAYDPLPAVREWLGPVATNFKRAGNVARRALGMALYKAREGSVIDQVRQEFWNGRRNVLFVCKGNICRSAFAEWYLRQHHRWISVRSAGTLNRPGRRPPEGVERIARQRFEVDMQEHRSQGLDEALVSWADVIVVMDYRNLLEVRRTHGTTPLVLLLGSMSGAGAIRDPYNRPAAEILLALNRIQRDVDTLAEALKSNAVARPKTEPRIA